MHSLIITALVAGLLGIQFSGFHATQTSVAIALAVGVLLIGLPHGSLDQKIGLGLFGRLPITARWSLFLTCYLSVTAMVILGWFASPLITLSVFFCMAAWHFGLEEETRSRLTWLQTLAAFSRGGMVIWVPALFQPEEVEFLITQIVPSHDSVVAVQTVGWIQLMSPLFLALLAFDFIVPGTDQPTIAGRPIIGEKRLRILSFVLLFALANPLVSFGVYFCAWHSVIGLRHLREHYGFSFRELSFHVAPMLSLAIALFAAGFLVSRMQNTLTPALVQTIFMGLSAVAIPHLVLHAIVDSIRLNGGGVTG